MAAAEGRFESHPSPDDVAQKAYELWLNDGRPDDRAMHHWFLAEQMLSADQGHGRGEEREGRGRAASPSRRRSQHAPPPQ